MHAHVENFTASVTMWWCRKVGRNIKRASRRRKLRKRRFQGCVGRQGRAETINNFRFFLWWQSLNLHSSFILLKPSTVSGPDQWPTRHVWDIPRTSKSRNRSQSPFHQSLCNHSTSNSLAVNDWFGSFRIWWLVDTTLTCIFKDHVQIPNWSDDLIGPLRVVY